MDHNYAKDNSPSTPWTNEGIAFYLSEEGGNRIPLYRYYRGALVYHFLTTF